MKSKSLLKNKYSLPIIGLSLILLVLIVLFITQLSNGKSLSTAASLSTANQVTAQSSCSSAPTGYAHCLSVMRTDPLALKTRPIKPSARKTTQPENLPGSCPVTITLVGNCGGYDPATLQAAYNLTASSASLGSNNTIAIVDAGDNPTAEADLATYRAQFNLPACTTANGCFLKVNQTGQAGNYPDFMDSGWQGEEALDLDMASAICPNCKIILVESNSNFSNDLAAAEITAGKLGAVAISNSFSGGENLTDPTIGSAYNQPGVGIIASSGDNGFPNIGDPATVPYVTSVGGTSLTQATGTTTRTGTETAWNQAGSGCSIAQPKPTYQHDNLCTTKTVSDVSAVADQNTPVWVYNAGSWLLYAGTSVSSPIIAGVVALNNTNYTYNPGLPYANLQSLNDITTGNNNHSGMACTLLPLCSAVVGYDAPTGLGTPNGDKAFTNTTLAQLSPSLKITSPSNLSNTLSNTVHLAGTIGQNSSNTVNTIGLVLQYKIDNGSVFTIPNPPVVTFPYNWGYDVPISTLGPGAHSIKFVLNTQNLSGAPLQTPVFAGTTIIVGNAIAPSQPVNLTVTSDPSSTSLTINNTLIWSPSLYIPNGGSAETFTIKRSDNMTTPIIVNNSSTSFIDTNVQPNTYYTYYIYGSATGSPLSSPVIAPVTSARLPIPNPSAPTNLTSSYVLDSQKITPVHLTWAPSQPSQYINSYNIYRYNNLVGNISGTALNNTIMSFDDYGNNTGLYPADTALLPGSTYNYTVKAVDVNSTTSAASNLSSVNITNFLTAPSNLTGQVISLTEIDLSWNASTGGNFGNGASVYYIYRNGSFSGSITGNLTSFADRGLQPNTTYTYYVVAQDSGGLQSPRSSEITATTQTSTPPTVPTGIQASAYYWYGVNLSWNQSTGGNPLVDHYKIFRNGVFLLSVPSQATAATANFSDGGLAPNTSYTYYVQACNVFNICSDSSSTAQATTQNYNPNAILSGTVATGSGKKYQLLSGVTVTATSASGVVSTATTNSQGQYMFASLAPAKYTISFQSTGYVIKVVKMNIQPISIDMKNVKLKPGV